MVVFGIDHFPGAHCETELLDTVLDHFLGTAHVVKHDCGMKEYSDYNRWASIQWTSLIDGII